VLRHLLLALLMLIPALASAAPPIDAQRISDHVRILGSDAFGGRAPATPGGDKAVAYIVDQFAKAGLSPGGEHGGWLQPVPVIRYTITGPVTASARSPATLGHFEQGESLILHVSHPGSEVNVSIAPMVFVGYGIAAPEFGWDDLKAVDLQGKVAIVLLGEPDLGSADGLASRFARVHDRLKVLAERGAAGVLFVYDPWTTGWLWATAQSTYLQPQYVSVSNDSDAPAFEGLINTQAAAQLFSIGGQNLQVLATAAQKRGFRAVPLRATFSASFTYRSEHVAPSNVIGILRGQKHPDEYVIYSAHWDHLGQRNDAAGKTQIYPGAVDNATGVAALIEMARAAAGGPRPDRSIVFLATTLEEAGLLGARYYVGHPIYPLGKTVADLNFDMLMPFGRTRDVTIVGGGKSQLDYYLARAARIVGARVFTDDDPPGGSYFRSDHFAFASAGVPAMYLQSGMNLTHGGMPAGQDALRAYMLGRYHQTSDRWSPALDFEGVAEDAEVYLELGRDLANSTDWPAWRGAVEFKAERDRTAALRN
jgi:Zn-dependent M28 family amino/carboxypeptidase